MANKLKGLKLTSVDLVRSGANQEADICLYKSAEEPPVIPSEGGSSVVKSIIEEFIDWMTDRVEKAAEKPSDDDMQHPQEEHPEEVPEETPAEPTVAKAADLDYLFETDDIAKFNPFHDERGRFANKRGFASYSANPHTVAGAKAIARSAEGKHIDTMNVHAKAGQRTTGQLYDWMKNKGSTVKPTSPKQDDDTKPKKPETDPKKDVPESKPYGNSELQNGHNGETYMYGEKAYNKVQQDTKCTYEQAVERFDSVNAFTGSSYGAIRAEQMKSSDAKFHNKDAKEKGDRIEEYIHDAPKWGNSGTLYRGIQAKKDVVDDIINKLKAGEAIDQRGTSSWSSREQVARDFAGKGQSTSIIFRVDGTMKGTSIKHLSKFASEDEVLVSKEARWRAKKIEQTDNGWVVDLVELP